MNFKDCGNPKATHGCLLEPDHAGEHKFPCEPPAAPAAIAEPAGDVESAFMKWWKRWQFDGKDVHGIVPHLETFKECWREAEQAERERIFEVLLENRRKVGHTHQGFRFCSLCEMEKEVEAIRSLAAGRKEGGR